MKLWKFSDEELCTICGRTLRGQKEKDSGLCGSCTHPTRGEFATPKPKQRGLFDEDIRREEELSESTALQRDYDNGKVG